MMRLCLFLLLLSYSVLSQNVSKEELGYLINKSIPLSLNHPTEQWHKLDKSLNNKKMVLLGECNHGSREIFLLKNNFIQHLNKTLDYDVILFESGLAEMIDYYEDDNIPVKQLSHVWETEAFEALLKYAKDQNMEVAGFDVFVTGDSFQKRLDKILDNLHPNIEKEYNLVLDSLKNRNVPLEHIADKANHIINIYKTYSSALLPKSKIEKLTKRGIENRIATLHYMLQYKKDTNFPKQLAARDSLMAANINWLMTEIYPNKKAIVYTHNIHASKYNKYEEMMGEWLKPKWGKDLYSIGTFVASGRYADYDGTIKTISEPEKNDSLIDIKTIIHQLPMEATFIEIPDKACKNTGWLFEEVIMNDTFIDLKKTNTMTLSQHYDGLIFIKQVSIPKFLKND